MIMEPIPKSLQTRKKSAVPALTRVPIQFVNVIKAIADRAAPFKIQVDGFSWNAKTLQRYSEKTRESMAAEQGFTTRTQVQAARKPQIS